MATDPETPKSDYERWKLAGSSIPFRYSFTGLLGGAILGLTTWEHWWHSPFRPVGLAVGVLMIMGTASLFIDIPRRRLSPVSKAFLATGFLVLTTLTVLGIVGR